MSIEQGQAVAERSSVTPGQIARAMFNTLASTLGFAVAVIVPARRWGGVAWGWPRGWIMVGVVLFVHVIGTLRILRTNPALLRERARVGPHPGRPTVDKVLLLVFTASYSAMVILSSIDATRWHVWPHILPSPTAGAGFDELSG